jgi:spore coat polysaccharide biosynthesis protein SpsF (cytidylyltransferase family)
LLALIQARLSSTRLPKKVLLRIGTKTILERCHQRVSFAQGVSKIVVSTSDEDDDKQIVNYCKDKNWHVSTGSLNDVGLRLLQIAKTEKKSSFVRISADSPFIDPKIIDTAISLSKSKKFDLVTNVFPRSFPKGQSVEIIKTEALDRICKKNRSNEQKEHMTTYFYENFEKFKIITFESGEDLSNSNHSVDEKTDLRWAQMIVEKTNSSNLSWQEIESISYKNKFSGSDE